MSKHCLRPARRLKDSASSAFTLVELLAVIGIVAILAAILIPVAGVVRKSARQTECLANLRTLQQGIISYANDHRLIVPYKNGDVGNGYQDIHWHRKISPYINGPSPADWLTNAVVPAPYMCPGDEAPYPRPTPANGGISYGINDYIKNLRINQAKNNPIVLFDSTTPTQASATNDHVSLDHHDGIRMNCSMLDGSVRSLSAPIPTATARPDLWTVRN